MFKFNKSIILIFFICYKPIQLVSSKWWYMSQMPQYEIRNGQEHFHCKRYPDLSKRQFNICLRYYNLMPVIAQATSLAVKSCQNHFYFYPWNCSTFQDDLSLFGKAIVQGGTQESAFVNAIISAGSVYYIAKACGMGHPSCKCRGQPKIARTWEEERNQVKDFKWLGCSENVFNSMNFARRFIDGAEMNTGDAQAKIILHNNRAGRLAVKTMMRKSCTCHGLSGSCSLRTCWNTLPSFNEVSENIMRRYRRAKKVNFDPRGRMVQSRDGKNSLLKSKRLRKHQLTYYRESPNFCARNVSEGVLGTERRMCQISNSVLPSCNTLCCGRGYANRSRLISKPCRCSFKWCCSVQCMTCLEQEEYYQCNSDPDAPKPLKLWNGFSYSKKASSSKLKLFDYLKPS